MYCIGIGMAGVGVFIDVKDLQAYHTTWLNGVFGNVEEHHRISFHIGNHN